MTLTSCSQHPCVNSLSVNVSETCDLLLTNRMWNVLPGRVRLWPPAPGWLSITFSVHTLWWSSSQVGRNQGWPVNPADTTWSWKQILHLSRIQMRPLPLPQIRLQPGWGHGTEDQLSHDQTPQFRPTETFLQYTFCYLKVTKFAVTYYTTVDNWCKSEDTNYDIRHESGDTTTGYYSPFNDNKGIWWTTLCLCNWHLGWNGQIPSDKLAKLTQEDNLGRTFKMAE